jgi:hypothetical protein
VKLVPDKISFLNRYQQVSYLRQTMENEPITIKLKANFVKNSTLILIATRSAALRAIK